MPVELANRRVAVRIRRRQLASGRRQQSKRRL